MKTIILIVLSVMAGAWITSVIYQYVKKLRNKRFREGIKIGDYCYVFVMVEKKEYKLKVRIKYINRDDHRAYLDSGIKQVRGWHSIDDLFIT